MAEMGRPFASYSAATSATAASLGAGVPAGVTFVRIAVTQDAWVAFGTSPTAVANTSVLLRASTAGETFTVYPGDKFSVLQVAAAGIVNVTEMS